MSHTSQYSQRIMYILYHTIDLYAQLLHRNITTYGLGVYAKLWLA